MSQANRLNEDLYPIISKIQHHQLYSNIDTIKKLKFFMGCHVFAVWDFMCLLKALYRSIICVDFPWVPPKDAMSANLVSSILTEEESDLCQDGSSYMSHYNMYLAAMMEVGAESHTITNFIHRLQSGHTLKEAFPKSNPHYVNQFVETTASFFDQEAHIIASVFTFGREAITESMFVPILDQLTSARVSSNPHGLPMARYYFQRHIELDSEDHFPKALNMLDNLCGTDKKKWREVELAAEKALQARIKFLDGIYHQIAASEPASLNLLATEPAAALAY